MGETEYPSNSHKKKEETRQPLKQVTKGKVTLREETGVDKIKNTVWGKYVKPALIFAGVSIILPALKDMAEDAVTSMIRGAFSGGDYSRTRKSSNGFVDYGSFGKKSAQPEKRELSHRARATHNFQELILESRAEGEYIISQLEGLIDKYDQATVKDMYELAGIQGSFTDEKWGWVNLDTARVRTHAGGYLLDMPRPENLE